jgi:hypothetical protein
VEAFLADLASVGGVTIHAVLWAGDTVHAFRMVAVGTASDALPFLSVGDIGRATSVAFAVEEFS